MRRTQQLICRNKIVIHPFETPEIMRPFAHQQHIFQVAVTAKIYHSDKITDSGRIRDARPKFIIYLIDINENTVHRIHLTMEFRQRFRLIPKDTGSNNQQFGIGNPMQILMMNRSNRSNLLQSRIIKQVISMFD